MRAVSGRAMRVLGMMSGTSADGIDVALVRISGAPPAIAAKFEGHYHVRFPAHRARSDSADGQRSATTTAEISQLNFLLGEEFARAAIAACKKWRVPLRQISLIGSHGQTIFHQGVAAAISGPACGLDTPDWRAQHHCGADRRDDDWGFPSRGYGGGRTGRAACAVRGLSSVSRCAKRESGVEYRRDRECYCDPRGRAAWPTICVRHWAREHGDRCNRARSRHAGARNMTAMHGIAIRGRIDT